VRHGTYAEFPEKTVDNGHRVRYAVSMTIDDAVRTIVETNSAHLIRYRKDSVLSGIAQYDVKAYEGSKRGWVLCDLFTASAIHAVFNALSEQNKAKARNMNVNKLAAFAMGVRDPHVKSI
jgi:hypothetical protein